MDIRVTLLLLCLKYIWEVRGFSSISHEEALNYLQEGKTHYQIVLRDSKMPKYGNCWLLALQQLNEGCKELTDEIQSRLALSFANCFLEKSGLRTYPCEPQVPIENCLRNVDSNGFTAYSNFFTHTQSMCFFIMSQIWHEETEATIQNLGKASHGALIQIRDFNSKLLATQESSLKFQRQMIENGSYLSKAIEISRNNVKDMLDEFRSSTDEQRSIIFEIFDRVSRLQNLIVSEVSWIYTIVFYGTCLLVSYLLTATKRTAEARLWLFALLSFNLIVERLITHWNLPGNDDFVPQVSSENLTSYLYTSIWRIRQISVTLSAALLVYFSFKYKDYNKINNYLLEDIRKQNNELHQSLLSLKSKSFDMTDSRLVSYINDNDDELNDDDNSESNSFDSQVSDRTFECSTILENESSNESSLEDENYYEDESLYNTANNTLDNFQTKKVRSRSNTPLNNGYTNIYNLRSRNLKNKEWDNPILDVESPNAFAKVVYHFAKSAKRNSDALKSQYDKSYRTKKRSFYSDDDDDNKQMT